MFLLALTLACSTAPAPEAAPATTATPQGFTAPAGETAAGGRRLKPGAELGKLPPSGGPRGAQRDQNAIPATQSDVTFCTTNGVDLKMDLYSARKTPSPAVISVHGGGWTTGSKTQGDWLWSVTPQLMEAGITVASVDYRLDGTAHWPAMIEDVKCAVRYLRANATTLGIDPNHIMIMGSSAGGQLASLVGTSDPSAGFDKGQWLDQSSRVTAVVSLFGPSDFLAKDWQGRGNAKNETVFGPDTEVRRKASPVTWVSKDDPPFLIVQGDSDPVVPPAQAPAFASRLEAVGVPAKLIMVKNGVHGLHTPDQQPSETEIAAEVVKFLVDHAK